MRPLLVEWLNHVKNANFMTIVEALLQLLFISGDIFISEEKEVITFLVLKVSCLYAEQSSTRNEPL